MRRRLDRAATGLAADPHAAARIDTLLAVQRKVVHILCRIPGYAVKLRTTRQKAGIYKDLHDVQFGIVCLQKSWRRTSVCLSDELLATQDIAPIDRRSFESGPGVVCDISQQGGILARGFPEQNPVCDRIQSMASPEAH
jgi:hypothetical protein